MGNALQRVTGLRAVRLAHGLKQIDVAKAAGVGDVLISRWERTPPPLWGRLVRVADALNVSADEILGRAIVTPVVDALAREDRELLDAMRDDCVALFGERLERMGGWRRIARYRWLGYLTGRVDELFRLPSDNRPMLPTSSNVGASPFPKDWFTGWESPRQKARRLNRPEPQSRRALPKVAP
jgi:transcriptional regulator with XRE-family HTH domain